MYRWRSGCCEQIETRGTFLNFIEDVSYVTEDREFTLEVGDTLILHTDGLTEAMDRHKALLEIHRFKNLILAHAEEDVESFCDFILRGVLQWCGARTSERMICLWSSSSG